MLPVLSSTTHHIHERPKTMSQPTQYEMAIRPVGAGPWSTFMTISRDDLQQTVDFIQNDGCASIGDPFLAFFGEVGITTRGDYNLTVEVSSEPGSRDEVQARVLDVMKDAFPDAEVSVYSTDE